MEPLSLQHAGEVVRRLARVRVRFAGDAGARPLVLPDAAFFPDRFAGDQRSVDRLARRLQRHAGLQDIPISVSLVDANGDPVEPSGGACGTGGCGSGACGSTPAGGGVTRVLEEGDGWRVHVVESELADPVVLTVALARALARIFLEESREPAETIDEPVEATTDLAAVLLGLGVLLLEGSHVYRKGCGGPSVGKLTALGPAELACALAFEGAAAGWDLGAARPHLSPTQREVFDDACAVAATNEGVAVRLELEPAALAASGVALAEAKSWLGRLLARRRRPRSAREALDRGASLEELEALVAREGAAAGPAGGVAARRARS
ncbi:MAG: hypothetical protein IT376_20335 [Polyangiaceae bacterium]|nr:hypothetical protein [Polyangiaceae bacterium]